MEITVTEIFLIFGVIFLALYYLFVMIGFFSKAYSFRHDFLNDLIPFGGVFRIVKRTWKEMM